MVIFLNRKELQLEQSAIQLYAIVNRECFSSSVVFIVLFPRDSKTLAIGVLKIYFRVQDTVITFFVKGDLYTKAQSLVKIPCEKVQISCTDSLQNGWHSYLPTESWVLFA